VFTNDEYIEKFHHFLHTIIATAIEVLRHYPADMTTTPTTTSATISARLWPSDHKQNLLTALVKAFSLNMPLYVTYKHLLFNHGRYTRITNCSCSRLSTDSISLLQLFCHTPASSTTTTNNSSNDNLPVELLRNIAHFVDLDGLHALKQCFTSATSDSLPIKTAHLIFNTLVNIRLWLSPLVIEQQIIAMRPQAIQYMCQLSDADLRLAGTRNTTELMYESFKELSSFYLYDLVGSTSQQQDRAAGFRVDMDGLSLALKYFMCSTLTIRLCGIVQMNLQISAWSECGSLGLVKASSGRYRGGGGGGAGRSNELADWFVRNRIVEHLFGPNLHVEVSRA
jgi:ubiquitin carboxyl-terminal hydrolase 34